MEPFFEAYFERLAALHDGIHQTIEDLGVDDLDWSAGEEINSLTVLAIHTSGAERYWISDVAGQERSNRVRSEEFRAQSWTAATLGERLVETLDSSRRTLKALTIDDLSESRYSWQNEKSCTVAWALNHALEHTALHLGHMQIGRQLWEQAHG